MHVSELVKKLKNAARIEAPPLGFAGVNRKQEKPRPVLVARASGDEKQALSLVEGADAVFIDTHQEEVADRFIKQLAKDKVVMPYGCWLGNNSGCQNDFYALNLDADMCQLKKTKAGKALVVEPEIEDKFLRQLDDLPVDAVVIEGREGHACRLTIKNYMLCRRLAIAINKPLLIRVDLKIDARDMEEMWDYGIDGFVVDVDPAVPSAVKDLRKVIDNLDLDSHRKKISLSPIIPFVKSSLSSSPEPVPDEDEDDDDYDE